MMLEIITESQDRRFTIKDDNLVILVMPEAAEQKFSLTFDLVTSGASIWAGYVGKINNCQFFVNHLAPETQSDIHIRMLGDSHADGVANITATIGRDCSAVAAHQHIKGLIVSDQARIYAKPELIIYHDDIVASHGCSVGGPDPEMLYYLQSRGIGYNESLEILGKYFLSSLKDEMPDDLRAALNHEE